MSTSSLSIYIPRVFANITKDRVAQVFKSLSIGEVSYIDFVAREDANTGEPYNMAFIHFSEWYDNTASKNFQEKVNDPNHEAKIVYDDPWYWLISKSNSRVPTKRPGPYIDLTHRNRNSIPDTTVVDDATQIFTEQDQINIDTFCPRHPELEKIEKEIDECLTHDVNMTHWENELDELECIKENQSHAI